MLIATASTLASPRKIITFSYGAEILAFLPKSRKIQKKLQNNFMTKNSPHLWLACSIVPMAQH